MNQTSIVPALLLALATLATVIFMSGADPDRPARAPSVTPEALAERRGALVDWAVFTQEADPGKIASLIAAGDLHLHAQGLSSATVFRRLRDTPGAAYDLAYGSSAEITLNPAGPRFDNGELNPFHRPAIREALNLLVDRRHVADELYAGLAAPRLLPISTAFADYARLADRARILELRYRHDPEAARSIVRREMEALGATLEDGRWRFEGRPVRLRALIRTEDARQQVGDYLANLLTDLGFQVDRLYRTAEEASRIWIAGDPRAGDWHFYTGAWISTAINRDEAGNFAYYYTPSGRPDPLWQAYTPDPAFAALAERLERRDYTDGDQRRALMAEALELALRDSARVWLVDQLNVTPRQRELELATDLAGGVAGSRLWPYSLRFRDRLGGTVRIGVPTLLTEPWNPVDGTNWAYDQLILRATEDPVLLPDPHTGLHWPQRLRRAEVTVEEGAPVARTLDWLELNRAPTILVPNVAWVGWNRAEGRFVTVGERYPEGVTARTRTLVEYEPGFLDRRWHDGSAMSLADLVLPWILTFERADPESPLHDASYVPTFEVFARHFRGWQILSRQPLRIAIYSDQIFPDAESIVAARAPALAPWHGLALGIRAERSGELTFSSNKADRLGVEWMNLVAGPSLGILARHLQTARADGEIPYPAALSDFMADGEPAARYRALDGWWMARRHFWVGDGPFYLHDVHSSERTVVLGRFADFPDPADKWLRFARPWIPEPALDGPLTVVAGPGGTGLELTLNLTFAGRPYPNAGIDAVRYLLFDGAGQLRHEGQAGAAGPGVWRIRLDPERIAALGLGANRLEAVVTSRRVALPAFATHVFATLPPDAQDAQDAPGARDMTDTAAPGARDAPGAAAPDASDAVPGAPEAPAAAAGRPD